MKTNAIIRIILLSLAILVLSGILLGALAFDTFSLHKNAQVEDVTTQVEMQNISPDIHNIKIEWVAGTITLQIDQHARNISVHEFSPVGSEYKMALKQSGQTLKIQFDDRDFGTFSFNDNTYFKKDLLITVPKDWVCNSLEIDTAAAEIFLDEITIREFDFDGASGTCRINNCDIGELDIDTASGNVYFSGVLETLDCDAASADCSIEAFNIPRSIKMDGLYGDLELILPPNAGFICDLDTMSGSFDSDFSFKTHDNTYVCGNGECKINVNGMSGAVSIFKGIDRGLSGNSIDCTNPNCIDSTHNHTVSKTSEHEHSIHH